MEGSWILFPCTCCAIHPDHTIRVDYDDGDKEDNVPLSRVRVITEENTEVMEYADAISESEEELLQAFRVFDTQETGTISALNCLGFLLRWATNLLTNQKSLICSIT